MGQFYGNDNYFRNALRIGGYNLDDSQVNVSEFLTATQKENKEQIEDNNTITFLLKEVKAHPNFIEHNEKLTEIIKQLKGADKVLKKRVIRQLQAAQNDALQIIKILKISYLNL